MDKKHKVICRDETIRSSHDTIRTDTKGDDMIIYDTIRYDTIRYDTGSCC